MKCEIKEVDSKGAWADFIDLPWKIYDGDPNWVPPLRIAVRDLLNPAKNPFFKHARMKAWLAFSEGQFVGRVAGVIDENHNKFHGEKTAFFGFFEAVNDQAVTSSLLNEVEKWVKASGMETLRGPMNPSTNHECGLLVDGFSEPPCVMMTYNPAYYASLLEGHGFKKAKDLFAYDMHADTLKLSDRILSQAERLKRKASVQFRSINMKNFDSEVERILEIYNDAWEQNWGFVPMDPEEFRYMAKDMKAIVDPHLLLIAEVKGHTAGFALALPDVNQAIKKVKDGKLFPTGLIKLLWNTKGPGRKKTINRCRILTLGIKKAYREYGLGPLFYTEYLKRGPTLGYRRGEASWILEDNRPMTRAMENMNLKPSKLYRIYDRGLGGE